MIKRSATFALLLLAIASQSEAAPLPESEADLVETWGSVIYCRRIYEEPDIKGRIYEGDRQACATAIDRLGAHAHSSRTNAEIQAVFQQATDRASTIRYNTRSVQQAVTACRELCRSLGD